MNPYQRYVSELARLITRGQAVSAGRLSEPSRAAVASDAPRALIFSPHPDDECIIGGLALRLMREAGMRVVNVAVTQGSNKARQAGRLEELNAACDYLGFDLVHDRARRTREHQRQNPDRRSRTVAGSVDVIARDHRGPAAGGRLLSARHRLEQHAHRHALSARRCARPAGRRSSPVTSSRPSSGARWRHPI